jgi:hypothetical protein
MPDIANVFDAVARERSYQDDKYGGILYRNLSIGDYLVILRQELREAEHAFVKETKESLLLEVLQVAAVAAACLEAHGIHERREVKQ